MNDIAQESHVVPVAQLVGEEIAGLGADPCGQPGPGDLPARRGHALRPVVNDRAQAGVAAAQGDGVQAVRAAHVEQAQRPIRQTRLARDLIHGEGGDGAHAVVERLPAIGVPGIVVVGGERRPAGLDRLFEMVPAADVILEKARYPAERLG